MDTSLPVDLRLDPYSHGLGSGSDDDVFSFFLGPAPTIGRQSAYMKRNMDKMNMPENYIGQNLYLRDTMEDWMFTANQTWYTERILPWRVTDQIKLQWTEMEANPHFLVCQFLFIVSLLFNFLSTGNHSSSSHKSNCDPETYF